MATQSNEPLRLLAGQRALITGANSGIGKGIAKGLAAAGASVVVNYVSNEDAARQVAEQLDAGARFADLAVLYDPNTGGELGWFPRGYLLEPELEEAAFSLEPGQFSDVIQTEVGYHILLVVERDPQHQLSPDAYLVMQENALQSWLAQKRAESDIVLAP